MLLPWGWGQPGTSAPALGLGVSRALVSCPGVGVSGALVFLLWGWGSHLDGPPMCGDAGHVIVFQLNQSCQVMS